MNAEHQRLLRDMLEARREYDSATQVQSVAWRKYLDAQAAFTGKFSKTDYPLGPFVVGEILIEHEQYGDSWPPERNVFNYRDVIRCPTSE